MAAEIQIIKLEETRTRRWKLGPSQTSTITQSQAVGGPGISVVNVFRKKEWLTDRDTESLSELRAHRKKLSVEARHAHLAHAFFRCKKYSQVEVLVNINNLPDLERVAYYVERFGVDKNDGEAWERQKGDLAAWIKQASNFLEINKRMYVILHEFRARDRKVA